MPLHHRWYLRDRYFDVDEAEAKLTKMLKWRQDFQLSASGVGNPS